LFILFSALYWEGSECQASEDQKDELKSSNKFEGKRPFVRNCCGSLLKFVFCVNIDGYYCVLYLYRPVQQNVHRRCEPDSETVVGVTCGELLAI